MSNAYPKDGYLLAVSCERCHGPGAKHVAYHRENTDDDEPHDILNPENFSRDRRTNLCVQCHSGIGIRALTREFSYVPGTPLDEHILFDRTPAKKAGTGIHTANQLARLVLSKCYTESPDLTCVTCHNPHRPELHVEALSAKRCQKCHEPEHCGKAEEVGPTIDQLCLECHMPIRRDQNTTMAMKKGRVANLARDHFITNWPKISDAVLKELKAKSSTNQKP